MIRAVIFDMDGLMIDTEKLHHESFKKVLEKYGITPVANEQGIVHITGISAEANWERFKKQYDLDTDTTTLTQEKNRIHLTLLNSKLTAMPGLLELLKDLRNNRYMIAIGSSSIREHIDLVTDSLDITEYFDAIASGDEVSRGKPAPDIFLTAAHKLGVNSADYVVLEDTVNGMRAANAANMHVIVVPNIFTQHENFNLADVVIPSLRSINSKVIASL